MAKSIVHSPFKNILSLYVKNSNKNIHTKC
nr:MAG TPA: hypothetical protein [Caudoviricetes sp.]DAY27150.1 MAG TPA: hypothetical protein [Caudoviricetes sp.]